MSCRHQLGDNAGAGLSQIGNKARYFYMIVSWKPSGDIASLIFGSLCAYSQALSRDHFPKMKQDSVSRKRQIDAYQDLPWCKPS